MPSVFDNVPLPTYIDRKPIVPVISDELQDNPIKAESKTMAVVEGLEEAFLPSGFIEARKEPKVLKATGKFVKGLGQSAILLPQGIFQMGKNFVKEITGKTLEERPISYAIDQGLKEGGLAVGFLTALQQTLPALIVGGAALRLPTSATVGQRAAAMVTGQVEKGVQAKPKIITGKEQVRQLQRQPIIKQKLKAERGARRIQEQINKLKVERIKTQTEVGPQVGSRRAKLVDQISRADKALKVKKEHLNKINESLVKLDERLEVPGNKDVLINTLDNELKEQIALNGAKPRTPKATDVGRFVDTRLKQQGAAGRLVEQSLRKAMEEPLMDAGAFTADLLPHMKNLSRNELFNLKAVLQNRGKPLNVNVANAAKFIKGQTEIIRNLAEETVPGFKGIDAYYPQNLPTREVMGITGGAVRRDIIDNMVKFDKTVKTVGEAKGLLSDWKLFLKKGEVGQNLISYVKKTKQINIADPVKFKVELTNRLNAFTKPTMKFSFFEHRKLDLPFYDPNPLRVLPNYYEGSFSYLHKVQNWGQSGEKLYNLVEIIRQEGGDANFAKNVVDFFVKGEQASTSLTKFRSGAMKYQILTKMGLSAIPNAFQGFAGSAVTGSLRTALRGLVTARGKLSKDFGIRSGGLTHQRISQVLEGMFGVRAAEGVTGKFLKFNLFKTTELNNFYISTNTGKFFRLELLNRLKKNPADNFAVRKFKQFKYNETEIAKFAKEGMTLREQQMFSMRFWREAQAIPDPLSLPEFATSPAGRVIMQLRTTATKQTRVMWTNVVGELKAGNPYPLVIAMTIFPAVGEMIGDIRDVLRGKDPFRAGGRSLLTNPSLINYLDRMVEAFAFGIASDLMFTVMNPFARGGIGGPTVSTALEGANAVATTFSEPRNVIKFGLDQIPIAGKTFKNLLFLPK